MKDKFTLKHEMEGIKFLASIFISVQFSLFVKKKRNMLMISPCCVCVSVSNLDKFKTFHKS